MRFYQAIGVRTPNEQRRDDEAAAAGWLGAAPPPYTIEVATDGARFENALRNVGLPSVRISGDDIHFVNLNRGNLIKSYERNADLTNATIVITGENALIENRVGGIIAASSGSYQAILGSAGRDRVLNSGSIIGYVRLGGGDDEYFELVNFETGYDRFLDLGDGDDLATFDLSALDGRLILSVNGGAGVDSVRITGIGKDEDVRSNGVAGVETIEFIGATAASSITYGRGNQSDTLILSNGLTLTSFSQGNSANPYTGPAKGVVYLNGGNLRMGIDTALARVIGSDAAEEVSLVARPLLPPTPATPTDLIDLGGGDDRLNFSYGNSAPLSADGGAGDDFLLVSQFADLQDLSSFQGFETVAHYLAIGSFTPFTLTGVGLDVQRLLFSGAGRGSTIVADLGKRASLAIGAGGDPIVLTSATTVASVVDSNILDSNTAASANWVENRGAIVGSVTLGEGDDRFANGQSGTVGGFVFGGVGDDIYAAEAPFRIYERADEGVDTVEASIDYRLGLNIERLTLTGADAIDGFGNNADNVITGNQAANRIDGRLGNDTMSGRAGDDSYFVGSVGDNVIESIDEGYDTVVATIDYTLGPNVEKLMLTGAARNGTGNALDNAIFGGDAPSALSGLDGADTIQGKAKNDVIDGGSGNDTLYGGAGRDVLTGGTGSDRFGFRPGDTGVTLALADRIVDFSTAEGDRMFLAPLDANGGTPQNEAFVFVGTAAFSKVAGELRYQAIGSDTFVLGDMSGDGIADLVIRLVGTVPLTASDFVL